MPSEASVSVPFPNLFRAYLQTLCSSGYGSESDGEEMVTGGAGEVTLPQDLPGRANIKSEQSSVRLSEVRWHAAVHATKTKMLKCSTP